MRKKAKSDTQREGLTTSQENKRLFLLISYPLSELELTVNIYKSQWWAIKFEEVAHKSGIFSMYLESVTQHLI
jgi:hypothetical protein